MLEGIKSYLNTGFDFYGVEIFEGEDEKHIFQVSHIKQYKKELNILEEHVFKSWDELLGYVNKKVPICLTYNGREVLNKLTEKKDDYIIESLLDQVFPNLDFNRFYYNVSQLDNSVYLAIVEKRIVEEVLKKFIDAQIPVLSLYFGLSPLKSVRPYIQSQIITTNSKQISFDSGSKSRATISKINYTRENRQTFIVNGLGISDGSLINFGSILGFLLKEKNIDTNYAHVLEKLYHDTKFSRRFQVLLWPIVGFFMTLLLVNFLLFNFYFTELETLNQESAINVSNKEKLLKLKNDVESKEMKVETILKNKNSKSTFFLDKIANSVPSTSLLENITYQPLQKPLRYLKPIEQDLGVIIIKGESNNANDFSNWIDLLENLDWIMTVETLEYGVKAGNRSYFTLKLTMYEQ